jgi:hypothetical protein
VSYIFYVFGKNCVQGAQTTLQCVLTDDNVNGKYYWDCREYNGGPYLNQDVQRDREGKLSRMVFEKTEKLMQQQ